jgi:hypothetical protein
LNIVNGECFSPSSNSSRVTSLPIGSTRLAGSEGERAVVVGGTGGVSGNDVRNENNSAKLDTNNSAKLNRNNSCKIERMNSSKSRNERESAISVRSVRTPKPVDASVLPLHPADILHADKQKIEQVLRNLVSNSLKFTPEGGKVTVCMKFVPDSEDSLKKAAELHNQRGTRLKRAIKKQGA